ncbi:hypothetical protein [Promicromonospora sp. NPDC019610]|uniref:hypothetical protein n=1 Tax=Promicromonospora sp. NPDC019610 TaxID=3364405 RepID=UPI00379BEACC
MPEGSFHDAERVYGPLDEEVRECLINVQSVDPSVSEDGIYGLYELLVGGRVVGPITLAAVPYVADLVEEEVGDLSELLRLLGAIADSNDEVGIPEGSARAAVVNELPLLLHFLEHQAAEVRRQAVYAVAQCRQPEGSIHALLARWDTEQEDAVRADLLFALALLDSERTIALLTNANSHEATPVRMAAHFIGIDLGLPWKAKSRDDMLALLQVGERLDGSPWVDMYEGPLQALVERMWTQGYADAAVDLLTRALVTDFGDHQIDLDIAIESALNLDEDDDTGAGGSNARTSMLIALQRRVDSSSATTTE